MGLFDIFKSSRQRNRQPALGYSLSSARQAIFHLARFSEDQDIREEAVKHIMANLSDHTKALLKKRFTNFSQTIRFALETESSRFDPNVCGHDQEFLIWMSVRRYCWKSNMVAIRHLADQEKLKNISINYDLTPNPEKRLTALSRLIDQDLILEVVLKASDSCRDVLQEALRRLPDDPKLLLIIIKKAGSPFIRLMALEKIDDLKIIRKIAVRNNYSEVRLEAMKRTGDEELFRRIARQDNKPENRIFALNNIDDQKVISQVARYDKDKTVRLVAIDKLLNKSILKRIAKNEKEDLEIRGWAANKLSDETITNNISSLKDAIDDDENERNQRLLNEVIERARDYFNSMSIVKMNWSLYSESVQKGTLANVINELNRHGRFALYDDDPRGTWRIISHDCENDRASFTINVENYMSDNGYVYDDITRLMVRRIGDDRFIWYQEKETRDLNP